MTPTSFNRHFLFMALTGFFVLGTALIPADVGASFADWPVGGRSSAVDGAVGAAKGDLFSIRSNPATLTDVAQPELGFYYGQLYKGNEASVSVNRSFFGCATPLRWGVAGVSYGTFVSGSAYSEETMSLAWAGRMGPRRTSLNPSDVLGPFPNTEKRTSYSLGRRGSAAGWNRRSPRRSFPGTVDGGVVVNMFRKKARVGTVTIAVDPDTGVSTASSSAGETVSATAWDMTVGGLWTISKRWRLGVAGMNLLGSDVGIVVEDRLPRVWNVSGARLSTKGSDLVEVSYHDDTRETRVHGGVERWLGRYALRAGGGYGDRGYSRLTGGCGVKAKSVRLDYGYVFSFNSPGDDSGTHQISCAVEFGGVKKARGKHQ